MAVRPYSEADTYDADRRDDHAETSGGGLGGQIFLWLAWALAAAFWGVVLTTGVGILGVGPPPSNGPGPGEVDAGGISWLLINFIGGLVVLGLAIAWGSYRWATRDRRKDPITEAATHAEYDMVEAAGGDDDIRRSPEAREPEERDAYRAVKPRSPRF